MSTQTPLECAVQTEGSIWDKILSVPVMLVIGLAIFMVFNYFQDKKIKDEDKKMKDSLIEGKIVKLRDGTVGEISNIDKEKGVFIINSAGTQLAKTIDSIVEIIS